MLIIRIYQDISGYIRIYQNLSEYIRIYQNLSEYIRIYQNISEYIRIYQNISEYIRIYQIDRKGQEFIEEKSRKEENTLLALDNSNFHQTNF